MATPVPSTDDDAWMLEPIPCAHPPTKPPAHVYDTIITVAVGPDDAKKKFKIYRGLLCHFSSYFDRMLNGSFREGGSTYLRLRDVDASTFHVFYYWLNSGIVDFTNGDASTAASRIWKNAIDAYIFADFHQAQVFKNALFDSLYLYSEKSDTMSTCVTESLYTNTCEQDAMRKFLVHIAAVCLSFESLKPTGFENCAKEFLLDVILACRKKGWVPGLSNIANDTWCTDWRTSFCKTYHTHEEIEGSRGNGKF